MTDAQLPTSPDSLGLLFRADCAAAGFEPHPGWRGWPSLLRAVISRRSLRVILLVRLMQKSPAWLSHLWRRVMLCYGCDFPHRSVIGPGLRMPHAYGIVLGVNTVLGRNVTIHQNVCITPVTRDWRRHSDSQLGLLELDDGVEVLAGSAILGAVKVGSNAVIGPLSVLTESLRDGATFCNALRIHRYTGTYPSNQLETESSAWAGPASWLAQLATARAPLVASLARRTLLSCF